MLKPACITVLSLSLWAVAQAAPPPVPVLLSPVDGANFQPTNNLVLSWHRSTGATSYQLQVSKHQNFDTMVIDQSGITDSTRLIGSLVNGVQYFWKVRATNASGSSLYATPRGFTTIPNAPGPTTLSSPKDSALDAALKPEFQWRKVTAASSYHLQIATTSDFKDPVLVDDSVLNDTTFTPGDNLAFGTKYYWRVRTKNVAGVSAYTTQRSLTTIPAPPAAPVQASPADNAGGLKLPVTLRWHKSDRAAEYRVQVSTKKDFSSNIVADDTGNDTLYQVPSAKLAYSTTYYWRVRAQNAGGNSAYADTLAFSTLDTPPIPGMVSPDDQAQNVPVQARFVWHKTDRTRGYRIQISTQKDFTPLFKEDTTSADIDTVKVIGGLDNKVTYYWHVESINTAGTRGYAATPRSFTTVVLTAPAAPQLTAPNDGAAGVSAQPVLKWHPADRARTYHVEVSLTTTFASHVFEDTNVSDTIRATTALSPSTLYYWRVTAKNAAGTNQSLIRSFTTAVDKASDPVLVSPKDSSTGQPLTLVLAWTHSLNAASYHLIVSTKNDFSTAVFEDSSLTDTSKQVGPLGHGVTYYWEVRAKNASGVSGYSDPRHFTTQVAVPGVPGPKYPLDNASDVSKDTVEFAWQSLEDATQYRLQVSSNPNFSSFVFNDTLSDTIRTVIAPMESNTIYYWHVQAANAGGKSKFSEIRSFRTKAVTGIANGSAFGRNFAVTAGGAGGMQVEFSLLEGAHARVSLINPVSGRTEILLDRGLQAGAYKVGTQSRRASGVYLVRLEAGSLRETRRIFIQ
jgi:hypothetical protein